MFSSPTIYSMYVDPEADHPLETVESVPDKFSIVAFLLNILWFAYYRMWGWAVISIAAAMVIQCVALSGLFSPDVAGMLSLGVSLLFGLEAQGLRAQALEKRGCILQGVVIAGNEEEAFLRFGDQCGVAGSVA